MKRHALFAIIASLLPIAACDKKASAPAPPHASGSGAHEHAASPRDAMTATAVTPAPVGPFSLIVTPQGTLAAGAQATLILELQDAAGARVSTLDVVHEKLIHLIVVAPDLSAFAHVHPEPRPDGTFTVDVTLPQSASYVVFADFRPTGGPQAVARGTVVVSGEPAARQPLVARALPARGSFDGFEVSVRSKAPLTAGGDAVLEFEIFDKGAPVVDLQNYLGARGHCVIIGEDTTSYLHSHPLGGTGSKVQFHSTLPAAGRYKVWAEFRPGGKPLLASFVIDVPVAGAAKEAPGHDHDHGGDDGHTH